MTPDILLDAFGMIDDRFLTQTVPRRRTHRGVVLLAAVISLLILSVGTAMAVSEDFRQAVFSIFRIETTETPPDTVTDPTAEGLRTVDIVEIDGQVVAHYFTSEDLVLPRDGGFYTCERGTQAPADTAFWEITADGISKVPSTRVDFSLDYGGRTIQIIFDWAVLSGKLAIQAWPQGMDENPVLNGWDVTAIGDRTDAALLSVPVMVDDYATLHYFLLDLNTQETIPLVTEARVTCCWFTDDLRYAIVWIDWEYWFRDMETGEMTSFGPAREPYFLDDETLVCKVMKTDKMFDLVRVHIPTGVRTVLAEDVTREHYRGIQRNGGEGTHCLLYGEDGAVILLNQKTGSRLVMRGLAEGFTPSESPDGTRVMIAYEAANAQMELGYGFVSMGILDPDSGVLKMLTRDVLGDQEYFMGWLDQHSLVISAPDDGGVNVYVYRFTE